MLRHSSCLALVAIILVLPACLLVNPPPREDKEAGALEVIDAGPGSLETSGSWTVSSHPCSGNRTDTLWVDDADTLWVGCGSTTLGQGLFWSGDGGENWEEPTTDPPRFFEDFRVSTLSRSADGLLYVGGTGDGSRVVSMDTSAETLVVTDVFVSQSQTWNSFQVGTFRRSASGVSVAESLTGADLAFRPSDASPFEDGYGWWTSGTSFQILDLEVVGETFYGCGSTIIQPPTIFSGGMGAEGFKMDPIELATDFSGELWSIAAGEGGLAAGGVDQDTDVGVIFTGPLNQSSASDWTRFDLDALDYTDPTWVRGVCRSGDVVVAVGEISTRGEGLVLHSTDAGVSFAIITPQEAPSLHRCTLLHGEVLLAGAQGYFARKTL
jgi:hypothetical protein